MVTRAALTFDGFKLCNINFKRPRHEEPFSYYIEKFGLLVEHDLEPSILMASWEPSLVLEKLNKFEYCIS